MTSAEKDCLAAEASVTDLGYNAVRGVQVVLGLVISGLLLRIVAYCRKHPVNLHTNLVIILSFVLSFYAIFFWTFIVIALRNFYLALSRSSPCDCLTPVWLVYALRMPFYAYIIAFPMLHFAITIERVRATVFIRNYESEGVKFGVAIVLIVVCSTLGFCVYVYQSTAVDVDTFGNPMVYFTLTSKFNAQALIYVHYFFLLLVVCISVVDYSLIWLNRRLKSNRILNSSSTVANYSLSRNYQANENLLTMRIIFPLDFSYTLFFAAFNLGSSYIRSQRDESNLIVFVRTYEAFILLLFVHAILTLVVYQYFLVRNRSRSNKVDPTPNQRDQTNVYFENLNSQWKFGNEQH